MARFHVYAPCIKVLGFLLRVMPLKFSTGNLWLLPNLVELEYEEFDLQAVSAFLTGSAQKVKAGKPLVEDSEDSYTDDIDDSDESDEPKVPRKGPDIPDTMQLLEMRRTQ
ncbi:hypothetical protein FRC10_004409, partial [Ceratobasidium sp. 414]